jgi:ABC-type polysaccharide/polyol phosphate export permease
LRPSTVACQGYAGPMAATSVEAGADPPVPLPEAPRRSLLRDAREDLRSIVRYLPLVRYLVASSLRTENRNTVLGFVWWVVDPLLMAAVYVILVGILLRRGGPDFPIFILTAIVSWQLFTKGARNSVAAIIRKERSMRQVAFPKSVLPLASVIGEVFHFAFGFCVLLVVAIAFDIFPSVYALLAIPIALVQTVFTLGVAFFLSAFNVFFRDTTKLMRYSFQIWFYLSPALYPVSIVPERFRDVYELNPFATFFTAYRDVVMEHRLPDFAALGGTAVASAVVLVLGYLFFVRLQPWFAKLV